MNAHHTLTRNVLAAAITSTILTACMTHPPAPEGSEEVRSKLTQLQSDPELATRAPVAIKNAEQAVAAAEQPQKDKQMASHLVYLADRKVDIAQARAETRLLEDQRDSLRQQREGARLDSRTREADSARMDANKAQQETDRARKETESARMETASARMESELARLDIEASKAKRIELEQQLAELNARPTERGMVVTLGDVLFATGKSELKSSATSHLTKLAEFLKKTDRSVMIEGHTDNVGSDAFNQSLSQQRADSVKAFLQQQAVPAARIQTSGKGESTPVASNETAGGRQQNRRVEVIIINDTVSTR